MKKFLSFLLISGLVFQPLCFGTASYPTSVKSFTTKVDNVDDVEAEHVNSLQDEVVAIETALGVGKATSVMQIVNSQSGAVATGTTILPWDDTIPQISEGDSYLSLAVTPKSATNILKIDVVFFGASTADGSTLSVALFQDATANALAAVGQCVNESSNSNQNLIKFTHYMTAGTTSATTFTVRAGASGAATTTFNGRSAGRKFGGVAASSITITEYKA